MSGMVICTNFNSAAYQKQYTLTMDKVNNKNEKQKGGGSYEDIKEN